MKDEFKDEDEKVDEMRKLFRNDFNNNPGTIQKKVKRSIIKKVTNDKGKITGRPPRLFEAVLTVFLSV